MNNNHTPNLLKCFVCPSYAEFNPEINFWKFYNWPGNQKEFVSFTMTDEGMVLCNSCKDKVPPAVERIRQKCPHLIAELLDE
jgi:hypothetical protein